MQYARIVESIHSLIEQGKSNTFLFVSGYDADDMRAQVINRFIHLCNMLNVNLLNETLDSLCEKFLQSQDVLLNGWVSHLFYDRAHLEAAIEQDTQTEIGNI